MDSVADVIKSWLLVSKAIEAELRVCYQSDIKKEEAQEMAVSEPAVKQ